MRLKRQQAQELKLTARKPSVRFAGGDLLPLTVKASLAVDLEKREITAYASRFDVWDDWNDVMRKGAFERSIKERFSDQSVSRIKVLHNHNWSQAVGLPTHMEEDGEGLLTVTRIGATDLGNYVLQSAAEGIIDGLSVGFRIAGADGANWLEWSDLEDLVELGLGLPPHDPYWLPPREILDVDLFEYSLTPFPAVDDARIELLKSMACVLIPGADLSTKTREKQEAETETPSAPLLEGRAGRVLSKRNVDRLTAAAEQARASLETIEEVLAEAQVEEEADEDTNDTNDTEELAALADLHTYVRSMT